MKRNEFVEYIMQDLLASHEGITARPMLGCFGIYKDGIIFAIVADGELYFKVRTEQEEVYKTMGSEPFSYTGKTGKKVIMPYWRIPPDIYEDTRALARLVGQSFYGTAR